MDISGGIIKSDCFASLYQWVVQGVGVDACTNWLHRYLAGRTQAVVINGTESDTFPILWYSTGSVLGPLLCLVYVNDLSSITQALSSKVKFFADDILLYQIVTNAHDYVILQEAITVLIEWSITTCLTFSLPKCKYMIISCKRAPTLPLIPLHLHNTPLEWVES